MLDKQALDEQAKLEWLRAAANEGAAEIERGDCDVVSTPEDLDRFMLELRREAEA